ncbi:MAG: glycerophosphodiester phosphodiesterase [Cellvibrionaceae bacterium]
MPNPLFCIAHRGGSRNHTENTLEAFQESLALGVDAIELDVWQVGDSLLITHDRRLGKTLPGQGRLADHNPEHLKSLQLACGASLTTLQEVLQLLGDKVLLNIELKGPHCAATVARALESFSSDHGLGTDHYLVSSFDHQQLYQFKQRLPDVKRGVLEAGVPLNYGATADALEAYSIHPNVDFINQAMVDDAHRRGFKVWSYTVNEPDDLQQMQSMGVDGVFTDYPRRVMALNQELSADHISR